MAIRWKTQPKVIGYWVFVATKTGELMNYGKDADTIYPFEFEDEAVDQAKYLSEENTEEDCIYICTIFENGQMKYVEYDL